MDSSVHKQLHFKSVNAENRREVEGLTVFSEQAGVCLLYTSCFRLTVDQTGEQNGKILSTLWLRQEDGTPLRGEIAVDGEIILTADFTSFSFYDTIENQE